MLRRGTLFRSGDLSALGEEGRRRIAALGVRALVDLRSAAERRARPYDWHEPLRISCWEDPAERSSASLAMLMATAEATAGDVAGAMRKIYRALPFSHAKSYAALFRLIARGEVPLIFNCAAGKDRTGVAAALLLWRIGVPRTPIVEDYLKTNARIEQLVQIMVRDRGWDGSSPKAQAMLRAESDYLDEMFVAVETRCGSIEAYVGEVLGISDEEVDAIERVLLGRA